jgi:glycine/D-amino acid oxidase-like deaminating enzyme
MSGKDSITHWQDLYWAAYFRMSDLADDIQDKVGLDIEYGASPITTLAFSQRMEAEYQEFLEELTRYGSHECQWLDQTDLQSTFPGLHTAVRGGMSAPQLQIEPYRFTTGLSLAAKAMGAEIIQGDVIDFQTEAATIKALNLSSGDVIEAGNVVLAMGPWTSQAAAKLGCEIPFYPTMEECIRIRPKKTFPLHSLVGGVEILARVSGDLVLATAEVDSVSQYFESKFRPDFNTRLSEDIKIKNIEAAVNLLPELLEDAELIEHRGDILSYGPDPVYQKPVIGRLPAWQNGYVASRFGGMGMVLSVGTGLIMADLIANNQVPYYARHLLDYLSPD